MPDLDGQEREEVDEREWMLGPLSDDRDGIREGPALGTTELVHVVPKSRLAAREELCLDCGRSMAEHTEHGASCPPREEPRRLREAAQWVVENWDRQASQGQSMPALRAALAATREDTERPSVIPSDHPETRKLAEMMRDTERPERHCPHCGKLMLVPGRNYEIDPAAVCRCGGRAAPPKNQLQAIVDFLDSWRYCPVSSSDNASRQCLEKAARELLTHLADSEATEACPWCSGANRVACAHCNGTGRRARASHRCGSCGLEHSFEGDCGKPLSFWREDTERPDAEREEMLDRLEHGGDIDA